MTVNILNSHFSPPIFCCLNVDYIFSVYFARTALYVYKFSDLETFFFVVVKSSLGDYFRKYREHIICLLNNWLLFCSSRLLALSMHFLITLISFYWTCSFMLPVLSHTVGGSGQTLSLRDIPGPFILTCIMVQRLNSYPYLVNSSF